MLVSDLPAQVTKLCVGNPVEILPGKLYFACFEGRPKTEPNFAFLNADGEAHYESFYSDFGPYNLAVLYRFCAKVRQKIKICKRRRIIFYSSAQPQARVNAAYLIAAYTMLYHNKTVDEAWSILRAAQPPKFVGFRDASMGPSSYDLVLLDVLRGIGQASKHGWLDFTNFNADEYEHFERVENGDFNWILPGKMLSFCGPHNRSTIENGYPFHAPETYFNYFGANNVSTIVRLNRKMYDARRFVAAGFVHVDLFFVDGSTPDDHIVRRFIDAVDSAPGAVAVHCKAGLGRTGTLIACWMMKEYGVTAAECIGWIRVCRPGSIIGPQQQFLLEKQQWCWKLGGKTGEAAKAAGGMTQLTSEVDQFHLLDQESSGRKPRPPILARRRVAAGQDANANGSNEETAVDAAGHSQGDRLLTLKAAAQHGASAAAGGDAPPPTPPAVFSSPTTPIKPLAPPRARGKPPSSLLQSALGNSTAADAATATRRLAFGDALSTKMPRASLKRSGAAAAAAATTAAEPSGSASRRAHKTRLSAGASDCQPVSAKKPTFSAANRAKLQFRSSPYLVPIKSAAPAKARKSLSPNQYGLRPRANAI